VDGGQGLPLQTVLGLLPVPDSALLGEHPRGGSLVAGGKICAHAFMKSPRKSSTGTREIIARQKSRGRNQIAKGLAAWQSQFDLC
jgi:hypothetical protein